MAETELRSCPFCGNVAELHERYHSIEEIAYKKSEIPKDLAIDAWGRRTDNEQREAD